MIGGLADCENPLCCYADLGLANNSLQAAGRWGDYRLCDTSFEAVQNAFDQINKQHVNKNLD